MKKENNDREIVSLTDIEHILLRPSMYVGGVQPSEKEEWILEDDGTIHRKQIIYTEALLKCINEIIDNSLDEYSKTNGKYSNRISVKISNNKITVEDNGRGLPVIQDADGNWMPVTAFTQLRAGSNFTDDNRTSIGTNGIGSSAANVFSKKFEVNTCDGKKRMKIICKDNLSSTTYNFLTTNIEKTGTKIDFIPDYNRFGVEGITDEISALLKTRLRMLSWFFPKCVLTFNGEKMNLKARELSSMFPSPNVFYNDENVYINVYKSDEPEFLTYVNGLSLRRGGSHIDYISSQIISDVREKLIKKYKNIKPTDIKNRLGFVVLFNNFPNCQFDSQTKEIITNNEKDVKTYLEGIDLTSKISKKILADKEMVSNITDMFRLKEELAEKKALVKVSKKRDIDSDKYFPPVGNKKYLMITEGYSAFSGLSSVLGRKGIAYYALKGKPLNCQNITIKKMLDNKEISDLISILGIDLSNTKSGMAFEKILFATDQDTDGTHIRSLLLALFNKICPDLFEEHRICILNTPLVIGMKGNKVEEYFFDIKSFAEFQNNNPKCSLKWKYIKGLGGWNKAELDQVVKKEGGLENLMMFFKHDTIADEAIDNWLGDNADIRKDKLRGREFHIDKI